MKRLVVHMRDQRPVWAMPEWVVDEIRRVVPDDWRVVAPEVAADGSGDGAGRAPEPVLQAVADAEVYLGFGVPAEVLEAGPDLRWVHSGAAGVGGSLTPEMRERDVVFTNSAGIHAEPMAETVVAMILHFGRGLDFAVGGQAEGRWRQEPFFRADAPLRELAGGVVGILGFGGIGREVARRVAPLGARVLALKRTPPEPGDATLITVDGRAALDDAVEIVAGADGWGRLLAESDYLVVAAPETDETRGMVDAAALGRMRSEAVLINVARGGLVDQEALVEVLQEGRIRGAALDVFASEPLPHESPLWELPNVLITPHVSAVTSRYWERETELITENLRRYLEGVPLVNVVDKDAGY